MTTADCGRIPNAASATSTNETTANQSNNSDSADITVLCTELGLVKTPDGGTVYPGANAVFTIVVTNYGPNAAQNVEIY